MIENKNCIIEDALRTAGIDVSVHNCNPDYTSHIEINRDLIDRDQRDVFTDLVRILTDSDIPDARLTVSSLEYVCQWCSICTSEVKYLEGENIRVIRSNFRPEEQPGANPELFTAHTYEPEASGSLDNLRICTLEDIDQGLTSFFIGNGATLLEIQIHPYTRPTDTQIEDLLGRIMRFQPSVVMTDKGLGYLDALSLIDILKRAGIATVMRTGESQTDETRRRADVFLEKYGDSQRVGRAIHEAIYIRNQDKPEHEK